MIAALRQGKTGAEILNILDAITSNVSVEDETVETYEEVSAAW